MSANTRRGAIFIDKGGTGKTTSAAHLGAGLEQAGHHTLLIDLAGKQGDLADALGVFERVQEDIDNQDDFPNVATTMGNRWTDVADMVGPEDAVDRLVYETESGVDLIPAHPDLDGLDADLGNIDDVEDRYNRLRVFLDEYVEPLDHARPCQQHHVQRPVGRPERDHAGVDGEFRTQAGSLSGE